MSYNGLRKTWRQRLRILHRCLTGNELIALRRIQAKIEEHRAEIGKPTLDFVVVEADWPEYDPTWRAIEARVTGAEQPAPHAFDESATIAGLKSAVIDKVCAALSMSEASPQQTIGICT